MQRKLVKNTRLAMMVLVASLLLMGASSAFATINGLTGTTFNFTAKKGYASMADGRSLLIWSFSDDSTGAVQLPGPTLLLKAGDSVTVNLTNNLNVNVSMIFPGMDNVGSTGGVAGLLATEASSGGGTVSYTFTATNPGTYYYQSATEPDLQVEMGLFGAIIVYPADNPTVGGGGRNGGLHYAYNDLAPAEYDSSYDREFLFLLSEMDDTVHDNIADGLPVDTSAFWPVYWFINGRNAPDTMLGAGSDAPWLPAQPYNCMPMMYPGEKVLCRFIDIGRDMHPYHTHGNHVRVIAQDGKLLETNPGVSGADLSYKLFTVPAAPGQTTDAIFEWEGKGLGYDVYGHAPADPLEPNEDPTYHGIPIPTPVPNQELLTFGAFYSGSPYLGGMGNLPPGEGGFNPMGGFGYMWHSHNEKEMTNNDIFPGGMMTMMFVVPWPAP